MTNDNEWVYEDDHEFQALEAAGLAEVDGEYDECEFDHDEEVWDGFQSDAEADADVLRMAGMGTDEDYCYYGGDEY